MSDAPQQQKRPKLPSIDAGADASFDPWTEEHLEPRPAVSVEDLATELTRIMKKGLPLNRGRAGDILPHLRSVIARSIHPYDHQSRISSLNTLLVRFLIEHEEPAGEALRVMFCVTTGTAGSTLLDRYAKAAEAMGYDPDHFRKRILPELIEHLATVIYDDLLRYKRRVKRPATAEEPTGDTPSLYEHHLTHEEELVSRIWARVYVWRAELIAQGRFERSAGYASQAEDHRVAAVRELDALRELIQEYRQTYGQDLIRHGEAEYSVEGLERLVAIT
ncbi:MAG: hypothetical protein R2707_16470 [Acidimicrobiales bacterium]